jgi:type IV pilus assembly protein PilP
MPLNLSYKKIRPVLFVVLSMAAAGCAQDNDDLYRFIDETKSKHLGSVKPIPQFEPYRNFSYEASELRDPFESTFEAEAGGQNASNSGIKRNDTRPREALETYPLDTLRMVGILVQNEQTWGLIKDPNNVVHRVQTGNYVGQNEGQIVAVSEQKLNVIEIIPDGLGGYIEREAALAIGNE